MACWKACVEFLLSVIEHLFLSLAIEELQGKMCQNSLPSGGGRSLGAKISGEGVVPGEYFLVTRSYKTKHKGMFFSEPIWKPYGYHLDPWCCSESDQANCGDGDEPQSANMWLTICVTQLPADSLPAYCAGG